jgi:YYY domain-containing protein
MESETTTPVLTTAADTSRSRAWIYEILLVLVLLLGAFFRFTGLSWDEYTWMHPDERFQVWVTSDIQPVYSLGEYFDTANSPLNPNNRGHNFYVYGTFPIFLTRYLVSALTATPGWQEIAQVGRPLSALFDLLTVLLVYLTAVRAYNRRVAILAAAFLAMAVLPIQLSNFYKEDTFLNFFVILALYFAVRIATNKGKQPEALEDPSLPQEVPLGIDWRREWLLFVGFGLALGLGTACKINAAPVAFVLPVAVFVRFSRLPASGQRKNVLPMLGLIALAAFVSLLAFRIFQPYAFSGPGFFNVKLNPTWVQGIREQRNQAAGDVDFPPSLQWARRPLWFGLENLIVWGFGLPLGLLAWFGFLWIGWRMLRGEWRVHIVLWSWVAAYFAWQSLQFNPTMRYFLPIYPVLAIYAGWALVRMWDLWKERRSAGQGGVPDGWARIARIAAVVLGVFVLAATLVYARAFQVVHTQPFTRAEASRWIYDNIEGPINLQIQTADGPRQQIVSFPYDFILRPQVPFYANFTPVASGQLSEIKLHEVLDQYQQTGTRTLNLSLLDSLGNPDALLNGTTSLDLSDAALPQIIQDFQLDRQQVLEEGQSYILQLGMGSEQGALTLDGRIHLTIEKDGEDYEQVVQFDQHTIDSLLPLLVNFQATTGGVLKAATLEAELAQPTSTSPKRLSVVISEDPQGSIPLASGTIEGDFSDPTNAGAGYTVVLDHPVDLTAGNMVNMVIRLEGDDAAGVYLLGTPVANEGEWDDGLPLRINNYDGFGGIYQPDLNFNMYWDDNPEKLDRFERILNESDYIFISSSRQWATLPRLPERFPLVTTYYRNLLGCPPEQEIEWCYNVAQPGTFPGNLGFDLVQVFQSNPHIGGFQINDQFAEEAFTVYDHPKVFVFKKNANYDPEQVAGILGTADLEHIIRVTPKRAASHPMNLMLPEDRLAGQIAGGTWDSLFNLDGLLNRFEPLGVIVWYLFILILGLAVYPLLRVIFPGLADHGYAVSRIVGMLVLAFVPWFLGSFKVDVTRLLIGLVFAGIVLVGAGAAFFQRDALRRELRDRRNYFLIIETLALAAFLFFLLVRFGNSDLWHPWKGGEKPMDFSYFNAILKSSTFPPFDPWYAGGYINYYYYGFVLVGMPVKLLGIMPSFAYNLILPTIFMLILLGAFTLGYNLMNPPGRGRDEAGPDGPPDRRPGFWRSLLKEALDNRGYLVGLVAALLIGLLGNLGTLRMIERGYQMIASPGSIEGAGLLNRIIWAFQGFFRALTGANLPYALADWYWNPSRVISAVNDVEPITEFPYFTLLYADLHAHLIALPVTLMSLVWGLGVIQGRANWKKLWHAAAAFVLGGLVIGALRPTNTWDLPTYLLLGMLAVFYAVWKYDPGKISERVRGVSPGTARVLVAGAAALLLAALAILLYQPYAYWYGAGYNSVNLWEGGRTPLFDYFTHWGVFIFLIFSWMAYESIDWMAKTPASALRKLQPYQGLIWAGIIGLVLLVVALGIKVPGLEKLPIGKGIYVAWVALPMAAWAGVLLLRPGLPDEKRAVLFLIGSGFVLTLVVEIIVLVGDIGRMNTVFKFYLQVWILFGISAAAGLGWILQGLPDWIPSLRVVWKTAVVFLFIGAAMYPLLATTAKIKDRIAPDAPRTLDGMEYMAYAQYSDQGVDMDLSQDYRAIEWMLKNIQGSPVILEGNTPEYRWGSRFTINTGLPGVVGWNWHQRQQRGNIVPADWVTDRIAEISQFYFTQDPQLAYQFLQKYQVAYFVVGQLEGAYYPGPGLDKFPMYAGVYWMPVYHTGDTTIYQVLGSQAAPGAN